MGEQGLIGRFLADETGATAIEYGLICAIIGTCLLGIASTGGALDAVYDKVAAIASALGGGGGGGGGG